MNIVVLDVRSILHAKGNPLKLILQNVDRLEENVLQLHTPFKPSPLYRVMAKRGYSHTTLPVEKGHFITQFYRSPSGNDSLFYLDGTEQPFAHVLNELQSFPATLGAEHVSPTFVLSLPLESAHDFEDKWSEMARSHGFRCHICRQDGDEVGSARILLEPTLL